MAIATTKSHVSRAKDFYGKDSVYFVLGKTTPWSEGNDTPHDPNPDDTITDILGYKKINSKYLVKPSEEGEISYRGHKWKIVSPDNAYSEGARWVYLSAIVTDSDLPLETYRQVGVVTSVEVHEDVPPGTTALRPDKITNPGILETIDNRKPTTRDIDQVEKLSIILEF